MRGIGYRKLTDKCDAKLSELASMLKPKHDQVALSMNGGGFLVAMDHFSTAENGEERKLGVRNPQRDK
jgi:hypothetical protein